MSVTLMKVSEKGTNSIIRHEGLVTQAYKDSASIWTIGVGFTSGSRIFSAFWQKLKGRKTIKSGDRISHDQALTVFQQMLDTEYGPYVNQWLAENNSSQSQEVFDACVSVVYNLGPRALKWRWAKALIQGDVNKAAVLLRKTGITAAGVRVQGLVNRREDEANLIEFGSYDLGAETTDTENLVEVQQILKDLGYYKDVVDGIEGPNTRRAVREFQAHNGELIVDGIAGKATLEALRRVEKSKQSSLALTAATTMLIGAGSFAVDMDMAATGCVIPLMRYAFVHRNELRTIFKGFKYAKSI